MNHLNALAFIFISLGIISCASSSDQSDNNSTASATPEAASTSEVASAQSNQPDPDEMICRREIVTGSNFRREVCLTRAQRASIRGEIQDRFIEGRSNTPGTAGPTQ